MAADIFDGLSEAQQAAVLEAGDIAVQHQREVFLAQEAELMETLGDAGVSIYDPADMEAWVAQIEPLLEAQAPDLGGIDWINRIRDAR